MGEEDFEDQGFFDSEVVKNGVESKEMCLDDEAVSENERGERGDFLGQKGVEELVDKKCEERKEGEQGKAEKNGEEELLEGEERVGKFSYQTQRFVFDKSILEGAEEFYVGCGVKSVINKFKGRVFARLQNGVDGGERWKCVLCMQVLAKEEGKVMKRDVKERDGLVKKPVPFKLSVFFGHLIDVHPEYVRKRLRCEEEVPEDKDCLRKLYVFFKDESGVDEKVLAKVRSTPVKRKRKRAAGKEEHGLMLMLKHHPL